MFHRGKNNLPTEDERISVVEDKDSLAKLTLDCTIKGFNF